MTDKNFTEEYNIFFLGQVSPYQIFCSYNNEKPTIASNFITDDELLSEIYKKININRKKQNKKVRKKHMYRVLIEQGKRLRVIVEAIE